MQHLVTAVFFLLALFLYGLGFSAGGQALLFLGFVCECVAWVRVLNAGQRAREQDAPRVAPSRPARERTQR